MPKPPSPKTPPSALDAIRFNRPNPDAIVTAGELANLRFKSGNGLSLRAAKLFCLLVQQAGHAIADDIQHAVPFAVINDTFHRSQDELVAAIDELHETSISVIVPSPNGQPHVRPFTKSGPILSDLERGHDGTEYTSSHEVRFTFSPVLRHVIANSNHWATISRSAVLAFESKYALRFYMYLSIRANLRKTSEHLTIDELRTILGVTSGSMPRWQDFKSRALEPAIKEINHIAGFRAGYVPVKRGRSFNMITLSWGLKHGEELTDAAKELERHRSGRKARRDGKAESIIEEHATLRHNLAQSIVAAPYEENDRER
jgi:plasmid replication initiation protein